MLDATKTDPLTVLAREVNERTAELLALLVGGADLDGELRGRIDSALWRCREHLQDVEAELADADALAVLEALATGG